MLHDSEGEVRLRVGTTADGDPNMLLLFEGILQSSRGWVEIGNVYNELTFGFRTTTDEVRISIWGDDPRQSERILVQCPDMVDLTGIESRREDAEVTDVSEPRRAAQRMEEAARQLAHSVRDLDSPSDSHPILGSLLDAQRSIEQILRQLADWHRSTSAGTHFSEGHDESTLGIMTAVTELDLAVQQADGLQETIARAYGGNGVVRWFDNTDTEED
ncbi:hypothetical protein [Pseudarthrobacter sp. S9]|uniref:hypothetical protein n=1 Tax=Pseudarthrobacter sp. S9 TaxID=3418421 RepID=UPI003CFF8E16